MSTVWEHLTLVTALGGPLIGVAADAVPGIRNVRVPRSGPHVAWSKVGVVLAGGAWFAMLVSGLQPRLGLLVPDTIAMAAGVGTVLLVLALPRVGFTEIVALTAVTSGLAATTQRAQAPESPEYLALGLAVVLLVSLRRERRGSSLWSALVVSMGVVALGVGLIVSSHGVGAWSVIGGTAVTALLTVRTTDRPAAVLLVGALGATVRVEPAIDGGSWVAIVPAAAAAALSLLSVRRTTTFTNRPAASLLALWTLAAAVSGVEGAGAATVFLAAGAVLAYVLGGPASALVGLPGTIVLTQLLLETGKHLELATLGVLAVVASAGLGSLVVADRQSRQPREARLVHAVSGLGLWWLVVAPTTWAWTKDADVSTVFLGGVGAWLDTYEDGVAIALTAGAAMAVLLALWAKRVPRVALGVFLPHVQAVD